MELAVLSARINIGREVGEQIAVEGSPGERRIEAGRVEADDQRLKAGIDGLLGEQSEREATGWMWTYAST